MIFAIFQDMRLYGVTGELFWFEIVDLISKNKKNEKAAIFMMACCLSNGAKSKLEISLSPKFYHVGIDRNKEYIPPFINSLPVATPNLIISILRN